MRLGLTASLAVMFTGAATAAELPADVSSCLAVFGNEQRLACYDAVTVSALAKTPTFRAPDLMAPALYRTHGKPVESSPSSPPTSPSGNWQVVTQTDSFDGGKIVAAWLRADSSTLYPQRRAPVTNKRAELFVACHKGETRFYVLLEDELVGSHTVLVDYRFDEQKPVQKQRWNSSQDSTAVGFWGGGASGLAKQVAVSSRLRIRTNHNVFGQLEAEFDTTGAREAVSSVAAACGWKV